MNEFAKTKLSYTRQAGRLTVTIGPREGSYKDMPAQRRFKIALPCQKAPLSATYKGRRLDYTYDGMNLEATIDLGMVDCAEGAVVEIEMPEAYALTEGTKADFRHIQTVVKDFKQHEAGMVYTENFGYLEAAPLRLAYHPEKQEETLRAFFEKYRNIRAVLIEQMKQGDNYKRALRLLNVKEEE